MSKSTSRASERGDRLPIVQYWDSGKVPDYIDELTATFRERNPDMRHLLFDEDKAGEFIAERLGEREVAAFGACAVPTMQSDYFRYCAAYALGGVYVDAGYRCVAPLRTLLEGGEQARLFRIEPFGYLLSGFFAFAAPGHPLPRLVLDVITANIERRVSEMVQMVTGPWSLSALSLLHQLGSTSDTSQLGDPPDLERLVEPFSRHAPSMAPTAAGRNEVGRMTQTLFEAAGSFGRIAEAFDGVRIDRYRAAAAWITQPAAPLRYKESDRYWANWQGRRTIFR